MRFFRFRTRSRRHYMTHRETVRAIVAERVRHFNQFYNLPVGRIAIRNQRSRWGSCSRKGNLNFNYKLAFLPPELRDYIVVHEICHIKEFNHGPQFWKLVEQTIPDYKALRKNLKNIA